MLGIKLRRQSVQEDCYSLHFGSVSIYDLTRSEAEKIRASYQRMFVSGARGHRDEGQQATSNLVRRAA